MFKRIPGTKDILPQEVSRWQKIEELSRALFALYNYQECRPPLLEDASLFNRSLGEATEIVQKQMFLIKNQEDTYVLRPEGTASLVRAYIENNLDKTSGFSKLYYIGPMFRLERPQKGRLRQFHHIGCEAIGSGDWRLDVEIIALADSLLRAFTVKNYVIKLNSLGCAKDRNQLSKILHETLQNRLPEVCEDCKIRFQKNTLRILDCKNPACQEVVKTLGIGSKHLCTECAAHFASVTHGLDMLGIRYAISPQLVRGLDYYTQTVFEITHEALGAQDAIGAGGRYNSLVRELDGPDMGAIGFAFGAERILLAASDIPTATPKPLVYVIALGDKPKTEILRLLATLRRNDIACDTDFENRSLKSAMRRANDLKARFVAIVGDNELSNNTVTLKDMESGEQLELSPESLIDRLRI